MTKYDDYDMSRKFWGGVFLGVVAMTVISLLFAYTMGAFDDPVDRIGIDVDALISRYVVSYYPEYENCTIIYDKDIDSETRDFSYYVPGANVYCNEVNDRDGMRVFKQTSPTVSLELRTVSKADMLMHLIDE